MATTKQWYAVIRTLEAPKVIAKKFGPYSEVEAREYVATHPFDEEGCTFTAEQI